MSTEVEQQPIAAPVVAETTTVTTTSVDVNGSAPVAEATTSPNGEPKSEEKKNGDAAKKEKEQEPPKDPKTETVGWLHQQSKPGVHKANFYVINWAINEVYAEDDKEKPVLPKSGFLTRNEFINYLKDGVILARLANKFQPGAAEAVKEGEEAKSKENQEANVNVFTSVAKKYVPEEEVFKHEDLEKGKESFDKIFTTLFRVMINAPTDFFKVAGGDSEKFETEVKEVVPQKIWQKLVSSLGNFREYLTGIVQRPFTRSNSNVEANEQPAEQNGTPNGVHATTTETENVTVSNGTKVEEKKEETHAVAAN